MHALGYELQDIHDHAIKDVVVPRPQSIKAVQDNDLRIVIGFL